MESVRLGPTAYEAAVAIDRAITMKIEQLVKERQLVRSRMKRYHGSTLLESERIATAAEPYQSTRLPGDER